MSRRSLPPLILFLFLNFPTLLMGQLPEGYPTTNRTRDNINLDWKFSKMPESETPIAADFEDDNWDDVCLPHNPDPVALFLNGVQDVWQQEQFLRDHNWYRKKFRIDLAADEKAFIEFEGVHNATELWVNGQRVGRFDINGYVPHHFDITEFVVPGELNSIAVLADNSFDPSIAPDPDEADYLKWAGIYRDVYLVKTNKLHVNFNWEAFDAGVHITTPTVNRKNGTVSVKTTVVNEYDQPADCRIETMIVDESGLVVKKMNSTATIAAAGQHSFRQTTEIEDDFHLWSPDDPYLYRAFSIIYKGGSPVDFVDNRFGFRKLELVDGQGLLLNGKPFFMVGLNRHQMYPHIGDAVPDSMHYEEALRYKQAGINTIRLSHYPQDDAFVEACDELGILVYEEPSTWIMWKQGEWMDKLEQSLRVMVRNHRNHPSITIWGAGINHRGPVPQLNSAAKEEDPWRLTASASSPWCGIKNAGVTDIYATMDYRRTDFPESDFCLVMEHGFSKNSQGNQFHISRYKQRKNNIGALLWVGADYNRLQRDMSDPKKFLTQYGMLTAYRAKKPAYYWYVSELTSLPFVHIADESAYREGKTHNFDDESESFSDAGKVHVFSNAPKVALYADDELVAVQRPDNDKLRNLNDHPSFTFRYHWTTETLTAQALFDGTVQATHSRTKAGEPHAIKLAIDYPEFPLLAGGSDLKMIRAYVVDQNNEIITDATNMVHFEVSGEGSVLNSDQPFIDQMQAHHGVATIYLKGSKTPGDISITATSDGLQSSSLQLQSVTDSSDAIANNARAVFDYPVFKIDLNGEGNLPQFGWTNQLIESPDDLTFNLGDNIRCSIEGQSDVKWTEGKYAFTLGDLGFMSGSGCYVDQGQIQLILTGLEAGEYKLTTYHHALDKDPKFFPYSIRVVKTDAKGEYLFLSDDEMVGYHDPKDNGERPPISVTNILHSNGSDPARVSFKFDKEEGSTWLNGFVLKRIR